jgi:hypothetical protein
MKKLLLLVTIALLLSGCVIYPGYYDGYYDSGYYGSGYYGAYGPNVNVLFSDFHGGHGSHHGGFRHGGGFRR